jgi:ribosomal subunit interface protein
MIQGVIALLLFLGVNYVDSFSMLQSRMHAVRRSARSATVLMNVRPQVQGLDLEITPAIQERVDAKIGKIVERFGDQAISCDVRMRTHRDGSGTANEQIVEVSMNMKGGAFVKAETRSNDMYSSIDTAAHQLSEKLKKHKAKMTTDKLTGGQFVKQNNLVAGDEVKE